MTLTRMTFVASLLLSVMGCTGFQSSMPGSAAGAAGSAVVQRSYDLQDVQVVVPPDLVISEAGGYYPFADVIWRGDAYGDRGQQIAAMFETASARITPSLTGDVPVIAIVTLRRFHGLTELTHRSIGGIYSIEFDLEIRNARSGAVIEAARFIKADLDGPGGAAGRALEQAGQTEKVRVTDHLTAVLLRELTSVNSQ